jgi:Flp pilus assembly protein TadB
VTYAPDVLFAVVAGGLCGGGLALFVLAMRGLPVRSGPPPRRSREEIIRTLSTRSALAVMIGLVVLVVTRWPIAAIGTGVLVLAWNGLAGGAAEERRSMARLEALAAWTESLRDTIAGAVGLEQAIPASVRAASPVLQQPLRTLVDRMHTRVPLPDALRRFADDLDDPSADLVVAALILNARLRGGGLRATLQALSASAREELDMRRRVEAGRRAIRKGVKIVVGVTLGFVAALALLNSAYLAPYDTALGQLVLLVVVAVFGAGFAWLRALSEIDMPQRFLHMPGADTTPRTGRGMPG